MMEIQAKRIIVHGMVQGVGFRYFVQQAGTEYGLTGNTRNCPDGTVEIIVEGNSKKIADFLKKVGRGPALSSVERVEIEDIPETDAYDSFLVEGQ